MNLFLRFCLCFYLFAFAGWILEVVYAAVRSGRFINRGFLNGPICPIYGLGAGILYLCLGPLRHRWVFLFLAATLVTTLLELVTGFLLEKIFHHRWWDYSSRRFSIGGYVCLPFSLLWGVLCTAAVKLLFPPLDALADRMSPQAATVLFAVLFAVLAVDVAGSVYAVIGLNRRLEALERAGEQLRRGSDALGEKICNGALRVQEEYNRLTGRMNIFFRRILDAFPGMKGGRYPHSLDALRENLRKSREERAARRRAAKDKRRGAPREDAADPADR